MFILGKPQMWKENKDVQQILVFSNHFMKEIFEREMESRFTQKRTELNYELSDSAIRAMLSDSIAGAVYKLRAVRDSNKMWIPLVSCAVTGMQLLEDGAPVSTPEEAFNLAKEKLIASIITSITKK